MALADGISFTAASSGTGTFVFGSARTSFLTLAQALALGEISNGQTVSYLAQDSLPNPLQREWGTGTYSSTGSGSVARTNVLGSVNNGISGSGSAINFTVAPTVSLTALAEDFPAGANPSGTAGPSAVNGSATTFMRSDGAPAIQKASAAQFGIVEVDGTTITAVSGVISGAAGANPTATAGAAAVNGSATTFMRSDGAPALTAASTSSAGIWKFPAVSSNSGLTNHSTTSASLVQAGYGSTCTITPVVTGRVRFTVLGSMSNTSSTGAGGLNVSYGTGAAPSNNAAATGTQIYNISMPTTGGATFNIEAIITGLTLGTAYWFDLQFQSDGTNTVQVFRPTGIAQEC